MTIAFPDVLPGHWATDEGSGMAKTYLEMTRDQLCGGYISDMAVATKIAMLSRSDVDHEATLTMAKDRIRWLSAQLAVANAQKAYLLRAAAITHKVIEGKRISGMDQNPRGFRDMLFSALVAAGWKP